MSVSNGGREVHLEGEVDGGVEGPGDLDLGLAVAHPVVAEVQLHVPRVGQPHHALHGGTRQIKDRCGISAPVSCSARAAGRFI